MVELLGKMKWLQKLINKTLSVTTMAMAFCRQNWREATRPLLPVRPDVLEACEPDGVSYGGVVRHFHGHRVRPEK